MSLRIKERNDNFYLYHQKTDGEQVFIGKLGEITKYSDRAVKAYTEISKKHSKYLEDAIKIISILPRTEKNQYSSNLIKEIEKQLSSLSPSAAKPYKPKGQKTAEGETRLRRILSKLQRFVDELGNQESDNQIKNVLHELAKLTRKHIKQNSVIVFSPLPYDQKQILIDVYDKLRKKKGEQLIIHNQMVPSDLLRIADKNYPKGVYDMMVSYGYDEGAKTRAIFEYPTFTGVLHLCQNDLIFRTDADLQRITKEGKFNAKYSDRPPLAVLVGKGLFSIIMYDGKGFLIMDKEFAEMSERYFELAWRKSEPYPEILENLPKSAKLEVVLRLGTEMDEAEQDAAIGEVSKLTLKEKEEKKFVR